MSHKLGDVCTLSTFIAAWAAAARQPEEAAVAVPPPFVSEFVGKTEDLPKSESHIAVKAVGERKQQWVTRRFVFDAAKVAKLKDVAAGSGLNDPSRVEVVTALFFKCAMAASQANCGHPKPSVMLQMVNLRPRITPPLPENSVGNFSWHFMVMPTENTLDGLVVALRKGLQEFCDKYTKDNEPRAAYSLLIEAMKEAKSNIRKKEKTGRPVEVEVYKGSSFCRYPFWEMDFGSGKPVWVAIGDLAEAIIKNTIHLIDAPGDGKGVEAWVCLEGQVMELFERDAEILKYASVNPSVF